ncbi:MAG: hypothetical protein ACO1TE_13220 [Prosthecobacter sp.]
MKSQKHRNRAPRPFKNTGNNGGWSDGGSFIPVSKKPALPVKKSTGAAAPEAPPPKG